MNRIEYIEKIEEIINNAETPYCGQDAMLEELLESEESRMECYSYNEKVNTDEMDTGFSYFQRHYMYINNCNFPFVEMVTT